MNSNESRKATPKKQRSIVVIDWLQVLYDAKKKTFYPGALKFLKDLKDQHEVFIVSEKTTQNEISNNLLTQMLSPEFIKRQDIFTKEAYNLLQQQIFLLFPSPGQEATALTQELAMVSANLESDVTRGQYHPVNIVEALRHLRKFEKAQCLVLGNNDNVDLRKAGYRSLKVSYGRWNKTRPSDRFFQDARIASDPVAAVDAEIKRQAKRFEERSKHWWYGPNNREKSRLLSTCSFYAFQHFNTKNHHNKAIIVRDLVHTACIDSGSIATATNFHRIADWSFFRKKHLAKSRQKIDHIVAVAEKAKGPSIP